MNNVMIYFDAHVHLYDCFDIDVFFDSAFENLTSACRIAGHVPKESQFFLMFTESKGINNFSKLETLSQGRKWSVKVVEEDLSFVVSHEKHPEIKLFIAAGRQLVTTERLEVAALLTKEQFDGVMPLNKTVEAIEDVGGIPVCPWGAGKWLGARGKLLAKYLKSGCGQLYLGDSGGRPSIWPKSGLLTGNVLSGSDPLPVGFDQNRVGTFGSAISGKLDEKKPAASFKELIKSEEYPVQSWGETMSLSRFVRLQLAIRK